MSDLFRDPDYDPFKTSQPFHPFRWIFYSFLILFFIYVLATIFGIASLPFVAVNNATKITRQIISPENALMQYRYFHDADARLKVFPAQIRAARTNLAYAEKNAPERASSRMTELTGITQVCETLVADYNSRAQRLDAGFFRNPEQWLPISTGPWQPLPPSYDPTYCEGASK